MKKIEKRPRLSIPLSLSDRVAEAIGFGMIIMLWVVVLKSYPVLPETIPIHFDAAGNPDGFGGKGNLFALPVLATILYAGMYVLNKFPHIFNYGVTTITPENALYQYTNATRMLRYLRVVIVLIFLICVLYSVNVALGKEGSFGVMLLPVTLLLVAIPVIYFLFKAFKKDKAGIN